MALTQSQITDLEQYSILINNIVNILDKETTINPTLREESGVSNANIDNLNDTLAYTLTAVDNIVNIPPSILPVITSFSPDNGVGGMVVQIIGTSLSSADVTFNGESAVITSNTATEIMCVVPIAATTGIITVTTPQGSTFTSTPFTINVEV